MGSIRTIEGGLSASGMRIAIICGRWNGIVSDRLIAGAFDALVRHGGELSNSKLVRVPGSFEIPVVARKLAMSGKFDAIVALGTLLKGETDHYEHVASSLISGLTTISQATGIPITYGVIAANTMDQAIDRAGGKAGNKGWEATLAAIETVNVLRMVEDE